MKFNDYAISVLTDRIKILRSKINCLEKAINEHDFFRTKVSNYSGSYFTSGEIWQLDYLLFKKTCSLEDELNDLRISLDSLLEIVEGDENGKE